MKLKTLKDLKKESLYFDGLIRSDLLKAEAIKWVKTICKDWDYEQIKGTYGDWICFFNITEEELSNHAPSGECSQGNSKFLVKVKDSVKLQSVNTSNSQVCECGHYHWMREDENMGKCVRKDCKCKKFKPKEKS